MLEDKDNIARALYTWHGEKSLNNAILKLAGEAGETLDGQGKHLYKPDWDFFKCVCGRFEYEHQEIIGPNEWKCKGTYRSKFEDELGDISYYIRVVEYLMVEGDVQEVDRLTEAIVTVNYYAAILAYYVLAPPSKDPIHVEAIIESSFRSLKDAFSILVLLSPYKMHEILHSNFIKLNSEETNHGWKE